MSESDKVAELSHTSQLRPIKIFYSYSHEDEAFRAELEKHLSLMRRSGVIAGWHDRDISAGAEWKSPIDEHLESAQIILLLVSADFLASDYCYDIELKRAMDRHTAGEVRVIPIILRPCDWLTAPFGKLQALPKNAKPITTWTNRDDAFLNIAQGIRKVAEELSEAPADELPPAKTPGQGQVSSRDAHASYVLKEFSGQEYITNQPELSSRQQSLSVNAYARERDKRMPSSKEKGIAVVVITSVVTLIIGYWQFVYKSAHQGSVARVRYSGRVIDAQSQQVIRGAKVSVDAQGVPQVYYTDSDGVFYLELPSPQDTSRIRVEASGYEVFDRNVSLSRSGIEDVRLNPTAGREMAALSGTVVDPNDRPIQGAKVTLEDIPGMQAVETSSDGVFNLRDIPKKYGDGVRVKVVMEGYLPNPYTEDVVLGKAPPIIKLVRKR